MLNLKGFQSLKDRKLSLSLELSIILKRSTLSMKNSILHALRHNSSMHTQAQPRPNTNIPFGIGGHSWPNLRCLSFFII
ncbi:hypothetical protein GIB67_028525 [Kingdonia uniflora]|uniref:Uncharacterized protein n=1 Tax=Kingdonia uniflora TaxID=39325 RepID=A0A7J7KW64_9MAGN|nr:hypothetical protein GIB67_028525 [Kingdonia uniflora]